MKYEYKCFNCGICCSNISIEVTFEELDIFLKLGFNPIHNITFNNKFSIEAVCPAYDGERKRCKMYQNRPMNCRAYHCGKRHDKDNRVNTLNELLEIMRQDNKYKMYKVSMETEAVDWGNKHGWYLLPMMEMQ